MAYTNNTWVTGDTITANKLNNMETGIKENSDSIINILSTVNENTEQISNMDTSIKENSETIEMLDNKDLANKMGVNIDATSEQKTVNYTLENDGHYLLSIVISSYQALYFVSVYNNNITWYAIKAIADTTVAAIAKSGLTLGIIIYSGFKASHSLFKLN